MSRYLILSSLLFLLTTASVTNPEYPPIYIFTGETERGEFCVSVASAGHVSSDGCAGLIVGTHFNDVEGNNAVRAYVFTGALGHYCRVGSTGNLKRDVDDYSEYCKEKSNDKKNSIFAHDYRVGCRNKCRFGIRR